jgi:regulator of PEP synthase PpsR (kinase-PPPase family)
MSQTTLALTRGGKQRSRGSSASGNVYIISDSSADLQSDIVEAFRLQFPDKALTVRVEPFVHTKKRLTAILSRARDEKAAICHVFMSAKLRATIAAHCKRYALPCCDLIADMFGFLSCLAGHVPPAAGPIPRQGGRQARRESAVVAGYD